MKDRPITNFSKHIIIYIAGFVLSKLKKELQYEECVSAIISDTKYASLQLQKNKGGMLPVKRCGKNLCENIS